MKGIIFSIRFNNYFILFYFIFSFSFIFPSSWYLFLFIYLFFKKRWCEVSLPILISEPHFPSLKFLKMFPSVQYFIFNYQPDNYEYRIFYPETFGSMDTYLIAFLKGWKAFFFFFLFLLILFGIYFIFFFIKPSQMDS